jgi:serine/threonine protein kinase
MAPRLTRKNTRGLLGEGVHGKTYRLHSKNTTGETFYDQVNENTVASVELYTDLSKTDTNLTDEQDIKEFLNFLQSKKDIVAKVFKSIFFLTGKTEKAELKEELEANRKVLQYFGSEADKFLTIAPISGFRDLKIIGAKFTLKTRKEIYVSFATECNNKYEMDADKFIVEILESIAILQDSGYQHNDIKLDNIVLCENRYKLIDWGQAGSINKFKIGEMLTSNPMKWYLVNVPKFAAKPIMKLRAFMVNSDYEKSPLFQKIYKTVNSEFETVVTINPDKKKLFKMYKNTFDIFMVGMTLIHAIHRYKLNQHKYLPLAKQLISITNPIHDAKEALNAAKFYLKNYKA